MVHWVGTIESGKRTSGQGIILTSMGTLHSVLEDNGSGSGKDQSVASSFAEDQYFARSYKNDPNIRVGRDKLQICIDQGIFLPIIMAYQEATKPYHDYGFMQDYTGSTIDE